MLVDINPNILKWAREESGMAHEDVAHKLELNLSSLYEWESGTQIPYPILEKLAHLYKRQSAVFFLNEVPVKMKKPKDYRNLAMSESSFSPKTMLAIRRTQRYLKVTRELFSPEHWNTQYTWLKSFTGKPENIEREIALLSDLLEIEPGHSPAKKPDEAFRKLREKVEKKLGIFVFQFPMPEEELDGFSYAFDEFPYAIVVNNQNAPVKKIFTLFHELAHILRHDPAVCKNSFNDNFPVELECNNLAGKFLVPKELLIRTESVDEIFNLASNFNISGEVYLRRLHEERKISKTTFFNLLDLVRERSNSFKKKKPKKENEGGPSMVVQSKSTRGGKFFEAVATAASDGKISYSAASDLLGLKVGNIRI